MFLSFFLLALFLTVLAALAGGTLSDCWGVSAVVVASSGACQDRREVALLPCLVIGTRCGASLLAVRGWEKIYASKGR